MPVIFLLFRNNSEILRFRFSLVSHRVGFVPFLVFSAQEKETSSRNFIEKREKTQIDMA